MKTNSTALSSGHSSWRWNARKLRRCALCSALVISVPSKAQEIPERNDLPLRAMVALHYPANKRGVVPSVQEMNAYWDCSGTRTQDSLALIRRAGTVDRLLLQSWVKHKDYRGRDTTEWRNAVYLRSPARLSDTLRARILGVRCGATNWVLAEHDSLVFGVSAIGLDFDYTTIARIQEPTVFAIESGSLSPAVLLQESGPRDFSFLGIATIEKRRRDSLEVERSIAERTDAKRRAVAADRASERQGGARNGRAILEGDFYVRVVSGETKPMTSQPVSVLPESFVQRVVRPACARRDSLFSRPGMGEEYRTYMREAAPLLEIAADSAATRWTQTGMRAHFRFDSLAAGKYFLWAKAYLGTHNYRWLVPVSVGDGTTVEQDLDNTNLDETNLYDALCGILR